MIFALGNALFLANAQHQTCLSIFAQQEMLPGTKIVAHGDALRKALALLQIQLHQKVCVGTQLLSGASKVANGGAQWILKVTQLLPYAKRLTQLHHLVCAQQVKLLTG